MREGYQDGLVLIYHCFFGLKSIKKPIPVIRRDRIAEKKVNFFVLFL